MTQNNAPTGKVTNQEAKIFNTILPSMLRRPFDRPTPSTAPTKACDVEIGMPFVDANTTVEDAAISAAKP